MTPTIKALFGTAVANALAGPKRLFMLTAGHFEYAESAREHGELREIVRDFFA